MRIPGRATNGPWARNNLSARSHYDSSAASVGASASACTSAGGAVMCGSLGIKPLQLLHVQLERAHLRGQRMWQPLLPVQKKSHHSFSQHMCVCVVMILLYRYPNP